MIDLFVEINNWFGTQIKLFLFYLTFNCCPCVSPKIRTEVIVVCFIAISDCWTKIFVQEKKSSDAIYFSDASNVCIKKTQRRFCVQELWYFWIDFEDLGIETALICDSAKWFSMFNTFLLKKHGSTSNFVSFKSSNTENNFN